MKPFSPRIAVVMIVSVLVLSAPAGVWGHNLSDKSPYSELKMLVSDDLEAYPGEAFAFVANLTNDELIDLTREAGRNEDGRLFFGLSGIVVVQRLKNGALPVPDIIDALEKCESGSMESFFVIWVLGASLPTLSPEDQERIFRAVQKRIDGKGSSLFEVRLSAVVTGNLALSRLVGEGLAGPETTGAYGRLLQAIAADRKEDSRIRRAALNGIAEMGCKEALPVLFEIASDGNTPGDAPLARSVCPALARLGAKDAIPLIGRIMETTRDELVFASAALSLGMLGGTEALELLVRNESRFPGDYAGCAIRKLDSLIMSLLRTGETDHLSCAVKAARHLFGKEREYKPLLEKILFSGSDGDIIRLVLDRLCQTATRAEAAAIVEALPFDSAYSVEWKRLAGYASSTRARPAPSDVPVDEDRSRGNMSSQEYGDPGYQDNGWWYAGLDWLGHTGIMAGTDSSHDLRILEMAKNGVDIGVQHNHWSGMTGYEYWGAYTPSNVDLTFQQRRNIVDTAVELVGYSIGYPALPWPDLLRYHSNPGATIEPNEVSQLRCDGVVEYCYEFNGVWVWGKNGSHYDVSRKDYVVEHNDFYEPFWPYYPNVETAPVVQCGHAGGTSTYMTRHAVTAPPAYDVSVNVNGNSVDLYITATDSSGIHYIKYKKEAGAWVSSPVQPQHPASDSYTAHFTFVIDQPGYVYYYALDNGGNSPQFSESIWIEPEQDPVPDVKINGDDGPLSLTPSDAVDITLSLDPGSHTGDPADWWIYVTRNSIDTYWWIHTGKWKKSSTPIRAAAADLRNVSGHSIYQGTLPYGSYIFTFAVDEMNNILEGTYMDEAVLTIQ